MATNSATIIIIIINLETHTRNKIRVDTHLLRLKYRAGRPPLLRTMMNLLRFNGRLEDYRNWKGRNIYLVRNIIGQTIPIPLATSSVLQVTTSNLNFNLITKRNNNNNINNTNNRSIINNNNINSNMIDSNSRTIIIKASSFNAQFTLPILVVRIPTSINIIDSNNRNPSDSMKENMKGEILTTRI